MQNVTVIKCYCYMILYGYWKTDIFIANMKIVIKMTSRDWVTVFSKQKLTNISVFNLYEKNIFQSFFCDCRQSIDIYTSPNLYDGNIWHAKNGGFSSDSNFIFLEIGYIISSAIVFIDTATE